MGQKQEQARQSADAVRNENRDYEQSFPFQNQIRKNQTYIQHRGSSLPSQNFVFEDEREIYNHEKLLLEQDAHLLEEQRYLNRLKNSELR